MADASKINFASVAYQLSHQSEDRSIGLKIVSIISLVLAVVFVALRLASRRLLRAPFKADDYVIIVALFFFFGMCASHFLALWQYGLGRHMFTLKAEGLHSFLKTIFITNLFYTCAVLLAKDSILLLYHRIFVVHPFQLIVKWSLAWMVVWQTVAVLVSVFTCVPVKKQWMFELGTNQCINRDAFYYSACAINIVTDFWILLLPVPMVFKLNIKLRQKLMLCGLFSLGLIVCICTVIRMVTLSYTDYSDLTWSVVPHFYWTIIEASLSFVCACLPTLRPLFKAVFKLHSTISSRSGATNNASSHHATRGGNRSHPALSNARHAPGHSKRSLSPDSQALFVSPPEKSHHVSSTTNSATAWHEVDSDNDKEALRDVEMGDMRSKGQHLGIHVRSDIVLDETDRRH